MPQPPDLDGLIAFYHELTPTSIARFPEFYRDDAEFKDPFNDVCGVEAIQRIFAHMFTQVDVPRFVVSGRVADADGVVLIWTFHFRARWAPGDGTQAIHGVSHLVFDAEGRIARHRDYWDAAEELYMKLPLLGRLMRWLQRRLAADSGAS